MSPLVLTLALQVLTSTSILQEVVASFVQVQ